MTIPAKVNFLGDSITAQLATLSRWFGAGATSWVNAGIAGQTSTQILSRVGTDVDPAVSTVCVVEAGLNDLPAGAGTGGTNLDIVPPGTADNAFTSIGGNIHAIVQNLVARGITPVLGTMLFLYPSMGTAAAYNPLIRTLNAWLRTYAASNTLALADYNAAFLDADGNSRVDLFLPGQVHPNVLGQIVYASVVAATIGTGPAWIRETILRDVPAMSGETVVGFAAYAGGAMQRRNWTFRVGAPGYSGTGMTDDDLDALARTNLGFS